MFPAAMVSAQMDASRVVWKSLEFEASKLFMTGTTKVRLAAHPDGEPPSRSPGAFSRLDVASSFAGRDSVSRVWFEPGSAAAFERQKDRSGAKAYRKTFRFTSRGIEARRLSPAGHSEVGWSPERWSRVEESSYPYPPGSDCVVISEPTLLFYLVSASRVGPGEQIEICSFSGKTLSRLRLEVETGPRIWVDYEVGGEAGAGRRREEIETLKFRVFAEPVVPGQEVELDFLGLEGDVAILADAERRLPVLVEGRLPHLGSLRARLVGAELAGPQD